MGATIDRNSNVQQPILTPRLAASPLRGLVTTAIQQMTYAPKVGLRQSWPEVKVRQGERHPCALLDRIVCDNADRGVTLDDTLGIARALMLGIRRVYDALPNALDYKGASLREQRAQSRLDPFQLQAQCLTDASDDDLERMVVMLDEQAEATVHMQLAVQVELNNRGKRREALRRSARNDRRSA